VTPGDPVEDRSALPSDQLDSREFRRRASAGVAIVASTSFVTLGVGFFGNLVLARLLVPWDFGLVAIGLALMTFAMALADGGLAQGLLRQERTPDRKQLGGISAIQLAIGLSIGLVAGAVAMRFGESGLVVATMMAALPIPALQLPNRIMLARSLRFGTLAKADMTGLVAFYGWSILGVLLGFGVWAMATGVVVRQAVGVAVTLRLSPLGFVGPSLSGVQGVAPIIKFGVRFQTVHFTTMVREQGLNAATGAIAGVTTLGLWSFMSRLLQLPLLFFESLSRVSFPAMAQLLSAKEDPRPLVERAAGMSALGAAVMLSTFVGAAPELVPGVFGEQWRASTAVVPWVSLALLIGGPVSVACVGYLYAANEPARVLRAALVSTAAWFMVALPLLPLLGLEALGIGALACAIVDAWLLARATRILSGARVLRPLAAPLVIAVLAGGLGWTLASTGPSNLTSAVLGGAAAAGGVLGGMLVYRRALLLDSLRLAARSARSAFPAPVSARGASDAV
jgi:O-antigen/teichoic acid export membrane protein